MGKVWSENGKGRRMRRIIDNDYLILLFRVIIGVTFIYASFYKILEPSVFAKGIWFYHILPGDLINLLAIFLPWAELICGIALIVGWQYRGAVILINLMMIMFMVALSIAIYKGISIDCGCFKASKATENSAMDALIRDFGVIAMTVVLYFSKSKKLMFDK